MSFESHIPIGLIMSATQTEIRVYACVRAIQGTRGETCVKSYRQIGEKASQFGGKVIDKGAVARAVSSLKEQGFIVEIEGGLRASEPLEEGYRDAFHYLRGTRYEGRIWSNTSVTTVDDSTTIVDDFTTVSVDDFTTTVDDSTTLPLTIHQRSVDDSTTIRSLYTARVNPPSKPTSNTQSSDTTEVNPEGSALPFQCEPAGDGDEGEGAPELEYLASVKVPLSEKERSAFGPEIERIWRLVDRDDLEHLFRLTYGDTGRGKRSPNGTEMRMLRELAARFPWEWLLPIVVAARIKGAALVSAASFADPWLSSIGPVRRNDSPLPVATGVTIHRLQPAVRGSPIPAEYSEWFELDADELRPVGFSEEKDLKRHTLETGHDTWIILKTRLRELRLAAAARARAGARAAPTAMSHRP